MRTSSTVFPGQVRPRRCVPLLQLSFSRRQRASGAALSLRLAVFQRRNFFLYSFAQVAFCGADDTRSIPFHSVAVSMQSLRLCLMCMEEVLGYGGMEEWPSGVCIVYTRLELGVP